MWPFFWVFVIRTIRGEDNVGDNKFGSYDGILEEAIISSELSKPS